MNLDEACAEFLPHSAPTVAPRLLVVLNRLYVNDRIASAEYWELYDAIFPNGPAPRPGRVRRVFNMIVGKAR